MGMMEERFGRGSEKGDLNRRPDCLEDSEPDLRPINLAYYWALSRNESVHNESTKILAYKCI